MEKPLTVPEAIVAFFVKTMTPLNPWRFCVAPMLDWTDKHCRYFHRQLSRHARLYTEMVTTGAIIFGDQHRHLDFNREEHPVALQLGGSDPADLARCAKIAKEWGYDEINLNCGCPSERVQRGSFGACLMNEPELVADCCKAMLDAVDLDITVKHRIGIDKVQDYGFVQHFVGTLFDAGVRTFIVHTRNAWLKGLSPKENREVPPLRREVAFRLKEDFPQATIVINGQVEDLATAETLLEKVDGVMMGRAAYKNPWVLSEVDARLFGDEHRVPTREELIDSMTLYLERVAPTDVHATRATAKAMIGLLTGLAGARFYRRTLSDPVAFAATGTGVLKAALASAGWAERLTDDRRDDDEF